MLKLIVMLIGCLLLSACSRFYGKGCEATPELLRFKIGDVEFNFPSSFYMQFELKNGIIADTRRGLDGVVMRDNWGGNPRAPGLQANVICQSEDDDPFEVYSLTIHNFGLLELQSSISNSTLPGNVRFGLKEKEGVGNLTDYMRSFDSGLDIYKWSDTVYFDWTTTAAMRDWREPEDFIAYHKSLVEFLCNFQATSNGVCDRGLVDASQ